VDENSNILNDFDLIGNEYNEQLISNDDSMNNEILINEGEDNLINNDNIEKALDDMNLKIINQKLLSTVRPTQLDAIVEDLNEENSDESDVTIQPVR
jgi:hypothetical protein